MKKEKKYRPDKIKILAEMVGKYVALNPDIGMEIVFGNSGHFHANLTVSLPGYGDAERCFNCGRNMEIHEKPVEHQKPSAIPVLPLKPAKRAYRPEENTAPWNKEPGDDRE